MPDGDLEVFQVKFAGSTLAYTDIIPQTGGLLIVEGIVLDGCTYALALYTIDIGCSNVTGENGILTVILEVTASERITVQTDTRSQQHVCTILQDFIANGRTDFLYKLCVPGT